MRLLFGILCALQVVAAFAAAMHLTDWDFGFGDRMVVALLLLKASVDD